MAIPWIRIELCETMLIYVVLLSRLLLRRKHMTSALNGSLDRNNTFFFFLFFFFSRNRCDHSILAPRGKATGRQVLQGRPVLISTAAVGPLPHTSPATHNLYFASTAPPTEGPAFSCPPARLASTFSKTIFSKRNFSKRNLSIFNRTFIES